MEVDVISVCVLTVLFAGFFVDVCVDFTLVLENRSILVSTVSLGPVGWFGNSSNDVLFLLIRWHVKDHRVPINIRKYLYNECSYVCFLKTTIQPINNNMACKVLRQRNK